MRGFDNGPLYNQLVLGLPLSEGTGLVTRDVSKYRNHGTITGAVWTQLPSGLGVLSFNDGGDNVAIADSASLDVSTAWGVKVWFKPTQVAATRNICSKWGYSGGGAIPWRSWRLDHIAGSGLQLVVSTDGTDVTNVNLNGNTTLVADTWYMATGTYDGIYMHLYLNGISDATPAVQGATFISGAIQYLGKHYWGANFSGHIGLFSEWNRVLSPVEVRELFHRERKYFGV